MPTYTYTCTACNEIVEKRQSFTDPPLTTCEQCGGTLRKIIHPVGIVFKGSGWYITDSRSSSSSTTGAGSTTSPTGSREAAASKPSETAPSTGPAASKDSGASSASSSSSSSSSADSG